MFCPKCGTQNVQTVKFCRNCGVDLGNVSEALTGNVPRPQMIAGKKDKSVNWESAIAKIFTGLAFLIIAAVLGITGVAGGQFWWFWMLIPAFGSLGSGIAQYVQLKKNEQHNASFASNSNNVLDSNFSNASLPPPSVNQNEIQNLIAQGRKIEAIKVFRETYNVGLKEAKDAVEAMERGQMPMNAPRNYNEPPPRGSIYDTGELTPPPSITENTTRHLEINSEGETMNLPKSNL